MKKVSKNQKEQIEGAYEKFRLQKGSIFREEVIGQNATVCKALGKKKQGRSG